MSRAVTVRERRAVCPTAGIPFGQISLAVIDANLPGGHALSRRPRGRALSPHQRARRRAEPLAVRGGRDADLALEQAAEERDIVVAHRAAHLLDRALAVLQHAP